jgi:hypothetical protein
MNNIQESANKINEMYANNSYFDQYGGQMFIVIILTLIVILVCTYFSVMLNVQPIKDDWANQRCKPQVMPFAGLINKPPGKTIVSFTQENFEYCMQNILKSVTGDAVQPLTYLTNILQNMYSGFVVDIQQIRVVMNNVRNSLQTIAKEIMERLLNMMIPLQQIILSMKDMIGKVQGILTTALYTSLGSYYALKSLLGAIVEFIVIILSILLALILVMWILPFTWPVAAMNSAIFLTIAIPLAVIVGFLTQVLGIQSSAIPQLSCFDENTMLELKNGTLVSISEIQLGDELKYDGVVTGKMKVGKNDVAMYKIDDIIVSGCHIIKENEQWIPVSEHPDSVKMEDYSNTLIYCLNTENKTITINNRIFTDWDELYANRLTNIKDFISTQIGISIDNVKNADIHKYLDGGFNKNTPLKLLNGEKKFIDQIEIGDILENGGRVYTIVEVDGRNVQHQFSCVLGMKTFVTGGGKINYVDQYLGHVSTLKIDGDNFVIRKNIDSKLYHLVTDNKTFKIRDVLFNDYNSCVDFLV